MTRVDDLDNYKLSKLWSLCVVLEESPNFPVTLTEALLFLATICLQFSSLDILRCWLYILGTALRVPNSGTDPRVFFTNMDNCIVCLHINTMPIP
jgi:hypothetical protein